MSVDPLLAFVWVTVDDRSVAFVVFLEMQTESIVQFRCAMSICLSAAVCSFLLSRVHLGCLMVALAIGVAGGRVFGPCSWYSVVGLTGLRL